MQAMMMFGKLKNSRIKLIIFQISFVENGEFMNKNKNEEKIKEEFAQNEEDGQPIDLSWPKTLNKQCIFILMIPIMIPLYYTLPDVKKEVLEYDQFNFKYLFSRNHSNFNLKFY